MGNTVLEIENLSKRYNSQWALKNINLRLEKGRIYGLIGKNGAGKTTLMRMVTGLSFPTDGVIKLFGKDRNNNLDNSGRRIGALIEYPAVTGNMTARENLHFQCLMRGIPNFEIEDELLALTGLKDTGRKKVKNFSLGMKQRLGIAMVLIGSPELLLLDEPINALDPSGVIEIRNLLKRLREFENKAILISSHNLPELYQTATDYIIIHNGEIKDILTHEELEEHCKNYISIRSTDVNKLTMVLERYLKTANFQVMPDKGVRLYDLPEDMEQFGQVLYDNGVVVTKLAAAGTSLEEYYMRVIGGDKNA
ncbi:MAG: ATP-binding cassette domain-containing protein [Lachnospiraceae bacterium]